MGVEEVNRKENPTQSTPFRSLFVGLKQRKQTFVLFDYYLLSAGSTSIEGWSLVSEICLL